MSRYIDADELWNNRPQLSEGKSIDYGAGFSECMWGFSKSIKEQISHPTADVVEVVRCKDCKYYGGVTFGFVCRKYSGSDTKVCTEKDHYCSYGERKEK